MTVRPFLALATTIVLLGGCTAGSYESGGAGYVTAHRASPKSGFGGAGGLTAQIAYTEDVGVAAGAVDWNSVATATTPAALMSMDPAAFAAARLVARNATLSVELPLVNDADGEIDKKATAKSIHEAAKAAAAICKELKGWVVYESHQQVVLRVPAESLEVALKQIGALGEVTDQTIQGSDVTDQHRDNAIRLDNLEKSRQRYIKLLEAAEDVKAALAVEKELQRVTLEIERLKGAQKALETSVRFSLVTVSFAGDYPEKTGPTPGPLGWIFYGLWWFVKWLFIWE